MSEQGTEQQKMEMPKHGEFCWTEIVTNNLETCKTFYTELFGWNLRRSKVADEEMDYQEISVGDKPSMGGMMALTEEMCGGKTPPPPHFMNYIAVDDVDEAASKAFDLGGTIVSPPQDIPNVGRFSIIKDPTGAVFSIMTIKV